MIFSSIFSALLQLVSKPQILIPFIILTIASAAVVEVSGFALDKPLTDLVLLNGNLPTDNLLGFFIFNYPMEIATLLIVGSIMLGIGVIAIMSVARMSKESGIVEAINDSVSQIGKTIGVVVIFWAIFVITAVAFTLAGAVSSLDSTAGIIVTWIFIIILFIAFVKLFFTFPALIKKDLKKAMQESWKFTDKVHWKYLLHMIGAILLGGIIAWFGTSISGNLGIAIQLIGLIIGFILFEYYGMKCWEPLFLIINACIIAFVIGLAITLAGNYIGGLADVLLSSFGDVVGATFFVSAVTNYFFSK